MPLDEARLNEFVGKMVGDMGAAMSAALMIVGDKLGLYKAAGGQAPLTSAELARRTGTAERYVREWLAAQAAAGYVGYDAATGRFALSPEQAMVFADEDSPVFMAGACRGHRRHVARRAEDHRGLPERQGRRLARARRLPLPRHRAILPPRLRRQSGRRTGCRRSTASWRS